MENPDRLIGDHLARPADRTVDSPHCSSSDGFGDQFDLDPRTASLTYKFEEYVPLHETP
jgi:hypothetical protein